MRVFDEIQRMNQWWVQLIQLALLCFLGFTCYSWFVLGKPMGNVAESDTTGQCITIVALSLTILLFFIIRLKTSIDERGIHYQFKPIHGNLKTIPWHEMESCEVRKYNPMLEYGGWGYKLGLGKGKALNIKGNMGIQIIFKSGKKLLIGTQRPEDATRVIKKHFQHERI